MTSCDHILYEGTANMALCGNRRCTPVGAASLIPGGEPSHYTHLDCSHLAQPTVPCFTLFPARLLLLLVVPALFMVPPFDLNAHCWLVFTTHLAWRIYRSQVRPGQHASEGCAGHGCGEVGGATYRHTHRALCVFMSRSGAGGFLGWLPACNSYPGGGGGAMCAVFTRRRRQCRRRSAPHPSCHTRWGQPSAGRKGARGSKRGRGETPVRC